MKILHAIYDLKVCPCTFDFVNFLYAAEMFRLHIDASALDLVIVANDGDGYRTELPQNAIIPLNEKSWKLRNVLLQADCILPSCRRVLFFPARDEAATYLRDKKYIYPDGYDVENPPLDNPIPPYTITNVLLSRLRGYPESSFAADVESLKLIDRWLQQACNGDRVVTLTFRELPYRAERNNALAEWRKFAAYLESAGFRAVIVRDTARVFEQSPPELEGFTRCDPAALNLALRCALYQRAYLNCFINNGVALTAWHNPDIRYLQFHFSTTAVGTTPRDCGKLGITPDYVPFRQTNFQRIYYDEDTFEFMRDAFDEMTACIDAGREVSPDNELDAMLWIERFSRFGAFEVVDAILEILEEQPRYDTSQKLEAIRIIESATRACAESGNDLDVQPGWNLLLKTVLELMQIVENSDDHNDVINLIQRLAGLGVNIAPFRPVLAERLAALDRLDEAAVAFEKHLRASPRDFTARASYAELLYRLSRPLDAQAHFELAAASIPPDDHEKLKLIEARAAALGSMKAGH